MRIALLHGFNVDDGGLSTVGQMKAQLEAAGHIISIITYGDYNIFEVRFRKHKAIRHIANQLVDLKIDAIIDHSNGANFEHKALTLLEHREKKYVVVRIAPALNRSTACAANVTKCTVFYSKSDGWVWISRFLIKHPWGQQGQKGYKGKDLRMQSWDYTDLVADHSDYFLKENVTLITTDALIALGE